MHAPGTLRICDDGREFQLTYDGLLAYHGGGAVAGASVGFRVMQAAAAMLAGDEPWERRYTRVISGHPGPGYRDAFEYVTRCVTRDRFRIDRDLPGGRHSPYQHYAFQFLVDDEATSRRAVITVRPGIVPLRLFEVLHALGNEPGNTALTHELDELKRRIAADALPRSTAELFETEVRPLR